MSTTRAQALCTVASLADPVSGLGTGPDRPRGASHRLVSAALVALALMLHPVPATAAPAVASTPAAWSTVLVSGSSWAGGWAQRGDLNVYSNGDGTHDQLAPSGQEYECVEFAQRWATVRYHAPARWNVNANGMWARGPQLPIPFIQHPNGGSVPPQFGDLIVWDRDATNQFGHVAVVAAVRPGWVDVVEQNWNNRVGGGFTSLPLVNNTLGIRNGLPPFGWLRSALEQQGYWMLGGDGGVFPFGTAVGYGSTGGIRLNQPVVGMAPSTGGHGYWLVAGDGGIFPFGSAAGYGSTGNIRLNRPMVGMAATGDGQGYWLVASDGGIFPFGDAGGYGSTGNVRLNRPVVGMAATNDGRGYWLVASDGGIFPFGNAGGYGSTGGMRLNKPIVGMAATGDGGGYWLVASDGGIFPFGDAAGYGSTGGQALSAPIVGMAATPEGDGYWLFGADGGVYAFGAAEPLGTLRGLALARPIISAAAQP